MPTPDEINTRIRAFQAALPGASPNAIVRQYITLGQPCAVTHDQYTALRTQVSDHFGLNPTEVIMVGSGKLGFSIAPKKRYRHFHGGSDIDIAIISDRLFDTIWDKASIYSEDGGLWREKENFSKYLLQGWIRPDKLPPSHTFADTYDWWEFFRSLTEAGEMGPYTIRAGLYRNHVFFERYQSRCIKLCQRDAA